MKHPIWRIVRHQGRTLHWLARRTNYSHGHVRSFAAALVEPSAEFRRRASEVMDLPEEVLFLQSVERRQSEVA